ncbi:MAG: cation:proton antiporter subunit C [Hyphomonadaceae bacterium]
MSMLQSLLGHANYIAIIVLMMGGLFIVFSRANLIKRMIGLSVFQTSVGLFYISLGKVAGGTAPIELDASSRAGRELASHLDPAYVAGYGVDGVVYSNPLPHVLILTAIVVGVATLAVGLAIAVRIREAYGTVEASEIERMDLQSEEVLSGEPMVAAKSGGGDTP